jgi:hypothetical protein
MLSYAPFIPAALLLVVLVLLITRPQSARSFVRAGLLTVAFWLASWVAVVSFMYAQPGSSLISSLTFPRDLGYLAGSALLMGVPFLAVLACGMLVSTTGITPLAKRVVLLLVAGIMWLSLPLFFFSGWVFGCVMLGGQSCL